jgi:hypothetical protein
MTLAHATPARAYAVVKQPLTIILKKLITATKIARRQLARDRCFHMIGEFHSHAHTRLMIISSAAFAEHGSEKRDDNARKHWRSIP